MMLDLSGIAARTVFALVLGLIALFLFFPIYWLAISALKPNAELYRIIPTLIPQAPSLEHFATAFGRGNLLRHMANSLIVSGSAAALNTILAMYAGYSFAKFRYRGRRVVMMALLSAQVFPFGLLLISIYPILTEFGLLDTRLGLTLSYIVFALPVSTYMLYSYFSQVPSELIEAARADGAGDLRIFHTIILPVSIPAIVTVFLYGFMWSWNDLLYSLTLIVSEELRTIGPGLLLSYLNEVNADWGGAMAASLVASAPVVMAFIFLQRWFIQGVTAGSVK
jgi:multiple sugar transport system permease protein